MSDGCVDGEAGELRTAAGSQVDSCAGHRHVPAVCVVGLGTGLPIARAKGLPVFDVALLAQSGVEVILAAMATDMWTLARARVAGLFGRGDHAAEEATLAELDRARASGVPDGLRALVVARLRDEPELAVRFAAIVEEVAARIALPAATVVQRGRADRGGTVVQAGRDVITAPFSRGGAAPR